jgi:hypothetical protein
MTSKQICKEVQNHNIHFVCTDCANEHKDKPTYDGVFTFHNGVCQICKKHKAITSAKKAFGYYRFI